MLQERKAFSPCKACKAAASSARYLIDEQLFSSASRCVSSSSPLESIGVFSVCASNVSEGDSSSLLRLGALFLNASRWHSESTACSEPLMMRNRGSETVCTHMSVLGWEV